MTYDEAIEVCVQALPEGWKLMLGREIFEPLQPERWPGLVGTIIWWATASSPREEGTRWRILSAERHPSLEEALADLTGQLRALE